MMSENNTHQGKYLWNDQVISSTRLRPLQKEKGLDFGESQLWVEVLHFSLHILHCSKLIMYIVCFVIAYRSTYLGTFSCLFQSMKTMCKSFFLAL